MRARVAISALAVALIHGAALGQAATSDQDLSGTFSTSHQRQQRQGVLDGCLVEFSVVFQDFKYRQGAAQQAVGSFAMFVGSPKKAYVSVKLGVRQIANGTAGPVEAPAFAYLQTKGHSTAKTMKLAGDSDVKGYRLWVTPMSEDVSGLLGDLMTGQAVSIAFNRKTGGTDLIVPIDLSVTETKVEASGAMVKIRGNETIEGLQSCFVELASRLKV